MPLFAVITKGTCWLLLCLVCCAPILAQETSLQLSLTTPPKDPVSISLLTGQSRLLIFNEAYGRLATPNQDVAESVPVEANQLLVTGKAPGQATLVVWAKDGTRFIFVELDVRANLTQLDAQMRTLLPQETIQLSQANGAVVLSGKVSSAQVIQRADTIAQSFGLKTVNLLSAPVANEAQVQLQVRVAEVNRNKVRELAVSPVYQPRAGTGGYANTGAGPWTLNQVDGGNMLGAVANTLNLFLMNSNASLFIRALQSQGALRALAEPNLVAMNGQTASFLAGGEIPIPVVQGAAGNNGAGAVSIQYKEYGVRLNFKPVIIDEEHIRLELEPEVSTLDYANSIRMNGFQIPALRTRKAKTGIELRDGQSFALAGLLDNNEVHSLSKVPGLGNIPLLGALFTSKQFQKQETELVFFVTATLTKPINPDAVPPLRGLDGLKNSLPLTDLPPEPAVRNRTTKPAKPEPSPATAAPKSSPAVETPSAPLSPALPPVQTVTAHDSLQAFERLAWPLTVPEFKPPTAPAASQVRREK
jgi:pilus assembly protein CpaC